MLKRSLAGLVLAAALVLPLSFPGQANQETLGRWCRDYGANTQPIFDVACVYFIAGLVARDDLASPRLGVTVSGVKQAICPPGGISLEDLTIAIRTELRMYPELVALDGYGILFTLLRKWPCPGVTVSPEAPMEGQ